MHRWALIVLPPAWEFEFGVNWREMSAYNYLAIREQLVLPHCAIVVPDTDLEHLVRLVQAAILFLGRLDRYFGAWREVFDLENEQFQSFPALMVKKQLLIG